MVACTPGVDAFRLTYPDNQAGALADVEARLAEGTDDDALGVGLTDAPHRLYAFDLPSAEVRWSVPVEEPETAPTIAGALVVLHEGGHVVARRARDGVTVFSLPDQRFSLVGAAGEGDLSAIVLSTTGGVGAQSQLIVAGPEGIRRQAEVEAALGVPAVSNGLVFVPWNRQTVSVLDGATGQEIARVLSHRGVIGHARVSGRAVYFGQDGLGTLTATPAEGPWYELPSALPGDAPLFRNAYEPPANARSASHRIRLAFRPVGVREGSVSFSDDTMYLTFYRFVFALDPADLSVRWAHTFEADIVGAEAVEGGVLIAGSDGDLAFLGTQGGLRWSAHLEQAPTVVALRVATFVPTDPEADVPPISEQLGAIAADTDSRLIAAREFALTALAARLEPEVTGVLITVCEDGSLPAPVRTAACDGLARRETGAEAVLAALARVPSFLDGTRPPPAGALATAALNMEEHAATPLLLQQLGRPDTAAADVPAIARAIGVLGDAASLPILRAFLWLYHADEDEALARGIAEVARAIVILDPENGREEIGRVLGAPFTGPANRAALLALLDELRAAEAEAATSAAAAPVAEPAENDEPLAE